MKITYENMTPGIKKTDTHRKIATILGWIAAVLIAFAMAIGLNEDGIQGFFGFLFAGMIFGYIIGGLIPGLVHIESIYSKIKPLLYIPVIGWFIWLMIVYFSAVFIGMIVMVLNLVMIILKKPVIYFFDTDYLMKREAEKNFTAAEYNSAVNQPAANETAENLRKLKEMNEQGLITDEEYNKKKSELLEKM